MEMSKKAIDRAMELKPNSAIIRMARATYFYHGYRDYGKALADYNFARDLAPGNSFTHFYAAMIYRRLGDFEKSIALSEQALEMDPRSILIIQNLAQSYYHVRNYERALILADLSLSIDSKGLSTNYAKIQTLFHSGQLDQARALAQTLDLRGGPSRIRFAYMSGNYDNIERTLSEDLSKSFSNLFYYYPRSYFEGIVLSATDMLKESREKYSRAIDNINGMLNKNSDDPRFHATLGLIYARLGEKKKSIQSGLKATELLPINRDAILGASYEKELTKIYVITGSNQKALEKVEFLSGIPAGFSYGELVHNPIFDSIRDMPRFQAVIQRLKP